MAILVMDHIPEFPVVVKVEEEEAGVTAEITAMEVLPMFLAQPQYSTEWHLQEVAVLEDLAALEVLGVPDAMDLALDYPAVCSSGSAAVDLSQCTRHKHQWYQWLAIPKFLLLDMDISVEVQAEISEEAL